MAKTNSCTVLEPSTVPVVSLVMYTQYLHIFVPGRITLPGTWYWYQDTRVYTCCVHHEDRQKQLQEVGSSLPVLEYKIAGVLKKECMK